jgi:hypothetical protein
VVAVCQERQSECSRISSIAGFFDVFHCGQTGIPPQKVTQAYQSRCTSDYFWVVHDLQVRGDDILMR